VRPCLFLAIGNVGGELYVLGNAYSLDSASSASDRARERKAPSLPGHFEEDTKSACRSGKQALPVRFKFPLFLPQRFEWLDMRCSPGWQKRG
jgi:hypothetical protein